MIHPRESLQFKILIAIILSLLFLLTICFYLLIRTQRAQFLEELQAEVIGLTDMVYNTLEHSMLDNDIENIGDVLSAIQKRERIKSIAVLDSRGKVVFSPYSQKPSQRFTCRLECHAGIPKKLNHTVFLKDGQGRPLLRSVQYLLNAPKCQKCHSNEPVRGILAMDISTVDVEQKIAKSSRRMLIFGILILFSATFVISVALRKLVIKPVQRLAEGTQQLGSGELSYRLKETREKDEVGRLIDSFNQMADMLKNAQDRLESWNEDLQREVEKKHQDLQKRNSELAALSEQRSRLLKQIISAQEEERKRVARELHDETGQALTALMINLDLIEVKLPPALTEVTEHLQHARDVVGQMKKEIHELIYHLRPSILDNLGLLPAIRSYARSVLEEKNIEVDLHVIDFEDGRLSTEKEICLFRVIQEAFANIAKHAKANIVTVQIERQQDIVRVLIEDDGVGFDVHKVLNPTHKDSSFGIRGMEERVRLLGGNFSVDSQVGFGTQLLIEIPIDVEEEDNAKQNQNLSGR